MTRLELLELAEALIAPTGSDSYKAGHKDQYPTGTSLVYSNLTGRSDAHSLTKTGTHVAFGMQYAIQVVHENFQKFFAAPKDRIIEAIEFILSQHLNLPYNADHFAELHDLGYIPLEVRAVPEGTVLPMKVPSAVFWNTKPQSEELKNKFFWFTNYIEAVLSAYAWRPATAATIAHEYRKVLETYANETDPANKWFVDFQAHDFSMRGQPGLDAAHQSGLGHLTSFYGTDTIPALISAMKYYDEEGVIGYSVPATEHSVMSAGGQESEKETFERLLKIYPTGIVSVVSDTWDLWNVLTNILPSLKDKIEERDGKIVIRPDSGDPVDILCGTRDNTPESNHVEFLSQLLARVHVSAVYDANTKKMVWKSFFTGDGIDSGSARKFAKYISVYEDLEEFFDAVIDKLGEFSEEPMEKRIQKAFEYGDEVNVHDIMNAIYDEFSDKLEIEDKGWKEKMYVSIVVVDKNNHAYQFTGYCQSEIIAGNFESEEKYYYLGEVKPISQKTPQEKGVVELLWDTFGGTVNEQGYKVLSPKVGTIYGDSITIERAKEICERLKRKGFASTNVVLGIGSFTYTYNTRDTYGFAVKSTYAEVNGLGYNLSKNPVTDNGVKKSAVGILRVVQDIDGKIRLEDRLSFNGGLFNSETYDSGLLQPIYRNGEFLNRTTIKEVRERLRKSLSGTSQKNKSENAGKTKNS